MRAFTSRYQEQDLIVASELVPVRISIGAPRFRLRYRPQPFLELAPERAWLRLERPEYEERYLGKLEGVGVDRIREGLAEIRGDAPGVVLLCFEDLRDPEKWCHRRMFAEWWEVATGELVPELDQPSYRST